MATEVLRARSAQPVNTGTVAARLSIATVCLYQVLLGALIFIRPELDPSRQPISEYALNALGRLGWIMLLAFPTSAVSYGALFVAVTPHVRGTLGRIGALPEGRTLVEARGTPSCTTSRPRNRRFPAWPALSAHWLTWWTDTRSDCNPHNNARCFVLAIPAPHALHLPH